MMETYLAMWPWYMPYFAILLCLMPDDFGKRDAT